MVALFVSSQSAFARTQANTPKGTLFAQKLVEATRAKHPETDEVGISAMTSRGCVGIASTDKGEIGEKCEKDDIEPMRTGKPYVEKGKDSFDVSLPLHDSGGKIIGTVGIGFKPSAGQTEGSVTQEAQKIASEMEAQILSKAKLLSRAE
jgi:sensor histidine kinase regulating citrate/malate metabolism